MVGTIELDQDGKHLLISFPYREDLVEEVRTIPGRRWDRSQKRWRVPADHVEIVYQTFTKHFFEFAPEVSGLLAGTLSAPPTGSDPAKAKQKGLPGAEGDATTIDALSVSALNERVRAAVRGAFDGPVWVIGEVVDFDKNKDRRHVFFALVEKQTPDSRPAARVDIALFERTAKSLLPRLLDEGLDLRDGIEIRVEVNVDLYVQNGRYQLIVENIDPQFTLGKMALSREQILRELRELDLASRNLELPLPQPALRLGVLTSPDSDGWNDFRRQLEESGIGFDVTLVPVKVQGAELKPTILAGLGWFAAEAERFDAVCILRGGGSRTDLAWFDDRDVALAVARHPLKILCGIGHQRDESVLDVIAHSEKTPTALGAFLVAEVRGARQLLDRCAVQIAEATRRLLVSHRTALADSAHDLRRLIHGRIVRERATLDAHSTELGAAATRRLVAERRFCLQSGRELKAHVGLRLERFGQELRRRFDGIRRGVTRRLERAADRIEQCQARQRLLDPTRVLRRGYALVHGTNGQLLVDATKVRPGMELDIHMRGGRVASRVERIHIDESTERDGNQEEE